MSIAVAATTVSRGMVGLRCEVRGFLLRTCVRVLCRLVEFFLGTKVNYYYVHACRVLAPRKSRLLAESGSFRAVFNWVAGLMQGLCAR